MNQSITIRDTEVKITDILDMISKGFSYYQILLTDPRLTLLDIMITAKVAKELMEMFVTPVHTIVVEGSIEVIAKGGQIQNLTKIREEHPRAYEKWSTNEEERLIQLFHSGRSVAEIAKVMQRQLGAVKTRLRRLGLIENNH